MTWTDQTTGQEVSDEYDTVLLAVGRDPCTPDLNLRSAGVEVDRVCFAVGVAVTLRSASWACPSCLPNRINPSTACHRCTIVIMMRYLCVLCSRSEHWMLRVRQPRLGMIG